MPVGANPLAITEVGFTLCTKVEIEKSLTEAEPLLNIGDEIENGDARDPVFEISLEGKGDLPDGILAGSDADLEVDGVTGGKTLVSNTEETEHHDTWNEWSASATNYPSAT